MHIVWDREALSEADAAVMFYQTKHFDLGRRFLDALEDTVAKIAGRPFVYRQIDSNIRRCKLPHFPYAVIYRVQQEVIQIIAVMHIR